MSLETQAKAKEMMDRDPIGAWQLLHDLTISAQEYIATEFAGDPEMSLSVAYITVACDEVKRVSALTIAQHVVLRSLEQKGMGPSYRDMIKTTRTLYGDERTPEQKAADRERVMAAAERLKVKFAKQQAEALGDLASGHMCGGIDKAEGVDL